MRLMIFQHFGTAVASLKRTRMRTTLTLLGVAIGIASVTTILALGGGIIDIINRQVNQAGNTIAIVRPKIKPTDLIDISNPTPRESFTTSPLTERDVAAIQAIDSVSKAVPLMTISGSVRSTTDNPTMSTVLATTPDFSNTTNLTIDNGQFIDEQTSDSTAVIGQQLAIDLFGTNQAVGNYLYIKGQRFTVIGTLKRLNNPINYNNIDIDHAIIISLESGKLFNSGIAQIQQINVKAKAGTDMRKLQETIDLVLKNNHDGEDDASVLIGQEIAAPTNKLFFFINTVTSLIAGISLVVGGIGIMNIMLVSVAERTREIGLRKAVGASNGALVAQFLIEALIISLIGGLLGYLSGYVVAFAISLFLPYDPQFSWQIFVFTFGLSVGVGCVFGLYPAIKASQKNVIESLRYQS